MPEERAQRRLAAILAADVVGYSRLMQADEVGTLTTLKTRRAEILQPLISTHHGRIVKVMGDGVLVEFGSAVNAVTCAVELQKAMEVANTGLPEDRRIVLRIGINLGDVMVEGSDLYGDGVNVAARLEASAEPGSVVVAETVYGHVRGKVQFAFDDLGEHALKNIAEPVRTYRVSASSSDIGAAVTIQHRFDKPSIAVLPFTNISVDPEQQYLSDGITEDIITELSRYRDLLVIARNSSFRFRDKAVDMKRIGRELGAVYLVEGSLRKSGDRLRVTAQLIEADTGGHIWADRYDRSLEDVFAIQDEVTQMIATTLIGQLNRNSAERASRKPTEQWAAYEYVLQANYCADRYDIETAETLLKHALAIDPSYALAYAALSWVYMQRFFDDLQAETLNLTLANAQKALSLDDRSDACHRIVGGALAFLGKYDLAGVHLDRAVALNPNNVLSAAFRANWLVRVGRSEEAVETLDEVLKRDPFPAPWFWELHATALFQQKRYQEVIESIHHKSPLRYWDHAYLAAAYIRLGRDSEAHAESAEVLRMKADFSTAAYAIEEPFKNPADQRHVLDAFRAAGLPG
jgi:TolB-like protein/class 3 adenylate cyclase